jgi:hypothetical protein
MKSSLIILLIGAVVAVAFAAPSWKVSMQDGDGGDKVAKTARWLGVVKGVVRGLNSALNGDKLALNQNDEDDDGDDLLNRALLEQIRMPVSMQDDDDDGDDKVAKTARWLGIARGVVRGLNSALNGEKLALNQDDEDDDDGDDLLSRALLEQIPVSMQDDDDDGDDKVAKTARWLGIARGVVRGLNSALNGEKLALNQDDEDDDDGDDKAKAQFGLHFHFG